MASAKTSSVRPLFSPRSKAKANYKSTNLRKLVTSGISDVVTASVHSEKTWAMKWIMNQSQELTVFHGCQKLTSAKN